MSAWVCCSVTDRQAGAGRPRTGQTSQIVVGQLGGDIDQLVREIVGVDIGDHG